MVALWFLFSIPFLHFLSFPLLLCFGQFSYLNQNSIKHYRNYGVYYFCLIVYISQRLNLDDYSSSYVFIKFSTIFKRKVNLKWEKKKQICAEVPGFSSPFSLTNQPSVYYSHESLTLRITPWTYPISNSRSFVGWNSNRGKDHDGEAYRRQ
jgi:hypothetical protein